MPVITNKFVEAADTPAKKDDYITLKGLRLVSNTRNPDYVANRPLTLVVM